MSARLTAIHPLWAIEGGRISLEGHDFSIDSAQVPEVSIGDVRARVVYASPTRLDVVVPRGLEGGATPVRVDGCLATVQVAARCAAGLHQVDNPVFDREGNLYVTYSGTRGQLVPVSIFRVRPNGTRETFSSGIVNPTSLAIDAEGRLYASSRFEGVVYRLAEDGSAEPFANDLGVACGLTFGADGTLYVGDRSGTIFKVDRDGRASTFASLPSSVAAFHLAIDRRGALFVSGPTLSPYDTVYRIDADGSVSSVYSRFGRPQGLAVDAHDQLFVVDALAGASGLFRVPLDGPPELVLSGPGLLGVAFDPRGGLVVCSNDTAYRLAL